MRVAAAACSAGLLALLLLPGSSDLALPALAAGDSSPQGCAGCAAEPVATAPLGAAEFDQLVADYAVQPMSEASPALETLLFQGVRTQQLIAARGTAGLDAERRAFLERELGRDQVDVSFRIVDEHGVERAGLDAAVVKLGEKTHLHSERTASLQPHEYAGRVERVGLRHLWTRY